MQFKITLNDAIYNAGIKGLIQVFEDNGLSYSKVDNYITFDSDILDGFTDCYLRSLMKLSKKDGAFAKISGEDLQALKAMKSNQAFPVEQLDRIQTFLLAKIKSASYKSGYEIIQKRGETYEFEAAAAAVKGCKDPSERCGKMIALIEKMDEYQDVFLLKDVIYTKVQPFWTNVAFLNKNENKTEFAESYENGFVKPIRAYVQALESGKKSARALTCCQCDLPITKTQGFAMSWINNQGVDLARKTSPFWNFNVDLMLCPICNLVYSCVPLGFKTKGIESYFVNASSSISELLKTNPTDFQDEQNHNDKSANYYDILRTFINLETGIVINNEVSNIQVLRRSGDKMHFNILSKDKLQKMKECSGELGRIILFRVKIGDTYYSLFDETMECIFNHESLHYFIIDCCRQGLRDKKPLSIYQNLCVIEAKVNTKGGKDRMEERVKKTDAGYKDGYALKLLMMAGDRNTKKIESLSFNLANVLRTRNVHQFIQLLARQYMSLGQTMPKSLVSCIQDEDIFMSYGDSFLVGLNGYVDDKKAEEE